MSLVTTSMHAELQSDIFIFGCVAGKEVGNIEDVIFFCIWDNPRQIDQKSRNDTPYLKCQVRLLAYRAIIVGNSCCDIFSLACWNVFLVIAPGKFPTLLKTAIFVGKKSSI